MTSPTPTFYIQGIECAYHAPDGRLTMEESTGPDGPVTTLYYKCRWYDRWNLAQALLPTCVADQSAAGFTRTPPFQLPANPAQVCTSIGRFQYVGSGWDGAGENAGDYAVLPATFGCVPWMFEDGDPGGQNDASGQAWTVTKIKPSCEVYQPTGGSYYVGPFPSTTPLDEASVGLLRPQSEIQVTRKMLPCMPNVASALGSVNKSNMRFGTLAYVGPEKYLLVAAESEPYFDAVGNPVMDVTYTYLGRPTSWNAVQNRAGSWQLLNTKADGSGSPPFAQYDFATLPR